MGSATTVLLLATVAARRGKLVGNGRGLNNCWWVFSCWSSCNSNMSSILTEAKPPVAPWREQ